jgi:hypothetical protein
MEMSTVTYKNQLAIERSRGRVPLAGTSHLYRVKAILWPEPVQSVIRDLLIPTSPHVCSGHCLLGDIRVDADKTVLPDILCDAARLPFGDQSFNSVLCDPPFNGRFRWNHDGTTLRESLSSAISRLNGRPCMEDGRVPKDFAKAKADLVGEDGT